MEDEMKKELDKMTDLGVITKVNEQIEQMQLEVAERKFQFFLIILSLGFPIA